MGMTQKDKVSNYLKKCGYIETSINKDYLINPDGKIYSLKSSRLLKPYGKRYLYVTILNKKHYVHRLVAEAFIPNPNNLPCVNHINGNKLDNNLNNQRGVNVTIKYILILNIEIIGRLKNRLINMIRISILFIHITHHHPQKG